MTMNSKTPVGLAFVVAALSTYLAAIQTCRCDNTSDTAPNSPAPASTHAASSPHAKRISFYEVPLVCPAASQIGCGSASKPLLLGLEGGGVASEAWLNRAGTIMAVVWSEQATPGQRSKALKSFLKQAEIEAKELTGEARRQALISFSQKTGWYRGTEVDRLSEEEAGVIAARLVGRIRAKITVSDEKAKIIEQGFTGVLKQKLTGKSTKDDAQEAMINICRQNLSQKDVAILQEAFAAGVCAIKDEK
jgi:hypothetical protein